MSGVRMAPILAPALKIPTAKARSFFGNHSATALTPAGKLPDSPRPKAKRAIQIFLQGGLSQLESFDYKPQLEKLHGKSVPGDERPQGFMGKVGLLHRPHFAREHVQAFGRELAGLAHAVEGGRAMQLDLAGLALWRERRVDVAHHSTAAAPPPRGPMPLLRDAM